MQLDYLNLYCKRCHIHFQERKNYLTHMKEEHNLSPEEVGKRDKKREELNKIYEIVERMEDNI